MEGFEVKNARYFNVWFSTDVITLCGENVESTCEQIEIGRLGLRFECLKVTNLDMSHQTSHALWSRQMTSHNLADRMSPSWKRDMFLLNLQRGHEAAMVFAIAQEYGCSLDASNGKSNEHQESRIAGPGYDVMLLLRLSADLIQFGNCHPLHRHSEGVWAAEFYWTFSRDEGALSHSQNQNMGGGSSKEVVVFPHKSWMPFLSVASQPGYLDLGTAVAVVTMLSSDYVSWWNGRGAITQHRCRGLLDIHHLALARMSIIKNLIAFIGFIFVWMVCLTQFSASQKKLLLVFDHVCELLTLRAYHSYMTSVGIRLSAKTMRSRCLWSAMLSDGSHLLEIWWRSLAAQAQKLIDYDNYGQIWKHDEKWWKMIVSEDEGFCTIISG